MKKQMFTDKKIHTVQLVSEELLYHILPDAYIEYMVEYSDETGETTVAAAYGGDAENPLAGEDDDLPFVIIKKSAKDISYRYTGDKNNVIIKL